MKKFNYTKGKKGEGLAERYFVERDYEILYKNYRSKFGELDLVVGRNDWLVFVEVKLRVGEDFGTPEDLITPRKFSKVKKTAEALLLENPQIVQKFPRLRIDAICIVLDEDYQLKRINHYENIDGQ